ncbi:Retrovirus-related Pol polyprotein from transposon RE1 [Chionoecetes opilio]|uniref:Retrovirus-related Pol polyprotein from transposon RE1 n=1 Tax=Chionoecetes opilio TaxID=41210 RepID=A0A8J4XN82_CHIOP|nr:Retrovirus-related Pol polyprotein from transposon RE1 [Chionoecetes opilio]
MANENQNETKTLSSKEEMGTGKLGKYVTSHDTKAEEKLSIVQKFKLLYKQYWYVLIPVHIVTSIVWYGSFFIAAKRVEMVSVSLRSVMIQASRANQALSQLQISLQDSPLVNEYRMYEQRAVNWCLGVWWVELGNEIGRVVHLRPPPEFADGQLWKLKKTVYGLCDVARHWYLRLKNQLLDLGAMVSSLDSALFSWRCNGKVEGVVCIYVDDFLWTGTPDFKKHVMDPLSQVFLIGSTESKAFKYVGLNIVSYEDGSITLDQLQYASTLTPVPICRQRATVKSSELSESERSEYRALVGQLNRIVMHTLPNIAFDACELSVACTRAIVADLLRLNKVIARVKTDFVKLCVPKMEELEDCYLECFSDASFANLAGNGSQGGFAIFLRDDGGKRCPVYWQSRKIKRVVKSTLSAEALALLECAETAVYLAKLLHEISNCGILKIRCFTDNKSLVDALHSCRCVEDRRLRIDIAVLCDMLERVEITEVAWVDKSGQLADCLTKKGASTERQRAAVGRN